MPQSVQQHLPLDHPDAEQFLKAYFPDCQLLRVPITDRKPVDNCYSNVRHTVTPRGGMIQTGWLITYIPRRFIEACHHAVWRNPDGKLEDVTDTGGTVVRSSHLSKIASARSAPTTPAFRRISFSWARRQEQPSTSN